MTITTMTVEVKKPVEDLFKAGNLLILKSSEFEADERYIVMVATKQNSLSSRNFTGIVLHITGDNGVKIGEVANDFVRSSFEQFHGSLSLKV